MCLAEITTDNPNVWFELGFAIASGKEVALVCADSRQRFPFDIQHRTVIIYKTDSSSDFETLGDSITKRIKAILSKEARIGAAARVTSPVSDVEGLASHEVVALVTVGQNIESLADDVSSYLVRKDMERAGYTRIAMTLGLASLLSKRFVSVQERYDDQAQEYCTSYSLTETGMTWLLSNQDKLVLREAPPKDEDIPF